MINYLKLPLNPAVMFKQKVILDTNFLLIPGQFNVNVFAEIEHLLGKSVKLCIIDKTIEELNKITVLGKAKDAAAAKLGMALTGAYLKQKSLKILPSFPNRSVDDAIVAKSNKKIYIATQDKELQRRVKNKGAQVIALKQKKYLILEK
ncbi:MAG: PIN domain-containing protein [archaeon]